MASEEMNEHLRAVLAQQQQLLQKQLEHHLQQLLDQHTVAIVATLEENFGSIFEKPNPRISAQQIPFPLAANVVTESAQDTEAGAAAAEEASAPATPSSDRLVHHHSRMADLTEEDGGPPVTMQEKMERFMHGPIATGIIAAAIMANTIIMYVQLQHLGSIANASLGMSNNLGSWGAADEVFRALEIAFGIFFLLEFLLNVCVFRLQWFTNAFNAMDAVVVLITSLETFVLQSLSLDMSNISYLRLLRLAKFARALRIVRTMRLFSKLRILVVTIYYSMASLLWSMVLLFFMMLMGTIFFCQMLHEFVTDKEADFATRTWVNDRFGSGNKAFYTFFEMTLSGGWPNYVSRVVKDVSPFYAIFVVLYVMMVIFGLIRIISALFLSDTLQQVNRDADIMVQHHRATATRFKAEMGELFDEADTSGDGFISFEEMESLLLHPKVEHWLSELGINVGDPQMLFDLLDDGDGQISKEEFVAGVTKLKGEARAQDLVPVAMNCQRILAHCKVMRHTVETLAASMDVEGLSRPLQPLR